MRNKDSCWDIVIGCGHIYEDEKDEKDEKMRR